MFLCVIPTSDKNYLVVPRSGEKKKLIKKNKNVRVVMVPRAVLVVQRTLDTVYRAIALMVYINTQWVATVPISLIKGTSPLG